MVGHHGGYVHGAHLVDDCIDDGEDVSDMERETVLMRSSALNGKSPDLIPVSRKGISSPDQPTRIAFDFVTDKS